MGDLLVSIMCEQITVDDDTMELLKQCRKHMPDTTPINRTYDQVIWTIAKEYLAERA